VAECRVVRRFPINFLISTGRRDQDHRRRAIRRRIILRIVVSREREQRPLTRITVTQPRAAHTSSSTCTPFNQRARVPRLPRPVLARGSHRQSNCCSAALRGQRSSLYRSLFASSPMSPGLAVGGLATPSDAHSKGMQSARTRRAWGYSFPPRPQGHSLNRRRRAD
jgi:hypothetical protein